MNKCINFEYNFEDNFEIMFFYFLEPYFYISDEMSINHVYVFLICKHVRAMRADDGSFFLTLTVDISRWWM